MSFAVLSCCCADGLSRYVLRLGELYVSVSVVCIGLCCVVGVFGVVIESVIYVFSVVFVVVLWIVGLCVVEHCKGEYVSFMCVVSGVYLRCRIRCSDFVHCVVLGVVCRGVGLLDVVVVVSGLDLVFGSVDR